MSSKTAAFICKSVPTFLICFCFCTLFSFLNDSVKNMETRAAQLYKAKSLIGFVGEYSDKAEAPYAGGALQSVVVLPRRAKRPSANKNVNDLMLDSAMQLDVHCIREQTKFHILNYESKSNGEARPIWIV